MLKHKDLARVFDSQEEAVKAILKKRVEAGSVIVICYEGPRGGPGMREILAATSVLMGTEQGENKSHH